MLCTICCSLIALCLKLLVKCIYYYCALFVHIKQLHQKSTSVLYTIQTCEVDYQLTALTLQFCNAYF